MQKGFAVVEEVDPAERRPDFVDHAAEQIEVEHAGLARARDAGFGRAARLGARDVARRGALDEHAPGQRSGVEARTVGASRPASGSFNGQSPQNFDPPAFRSDRSVEMVGPVQTSAKLVVRASPSTRVA